tara:strand:- start:156 stop:323 length:168 start_codon:yes stop_codon:yes gene_type:complete
MSKNTWAYVYGDECDFLWNHFGLSKRDSNDRIEIKLVNFETADEYGFEYQEDKIT